MDDFAAPWADTSAIGGYRILRTHPPRRRPPPSRRASHPVRLRGLLSVLLAGGFALVVLPGPATCPCSLARAGAAEIVTAALMEPGEAASAAAATAAPAPDVAPPVLLQAREEPLPVVVAAVPAIPEIALRDAEPPQAAQDAQTRPRVRSSLRSRGGRTRTAATRAAANKPGGILRAPRWAHQMFETPWQSKAFSYMQ